MTFRLMNHAWVLLVAATGACGSPPPAEAPSGSAPSTGSVSGAATSNVPDASVAPAAVQDAGPVESAAPAHPFAATPAEATNLIDTAIDARVNDLARCVETARARRKNPHQKISVEVGIDEQGHLMGVKAPPGGPKDPDLYACVQAALMGANFPTSHAGIITVTKSFEEQAVYR